ncbi:MAG: proline dehydrogenase family protein [Chloroflexi bacterium]|nr:proline dehydrogenase family protein [Chloroflexota bacterium]
MLRPLFIHLSHAPWARQFITRFVFARRAASRFIAGETPEDAIHVIRGLNAKGISASVDHLGENVLSESDATRAADDYLTILDQICASGVKSHASVKLTQLGLDLGESVCLNNMRRILSRARDCGTFVRVDMEGSDYTERTLTVVRTIKHDYGFDNVGAVIQSYLYRSEKDVRELAEEGVRVRLCKGAYSEPPDRAFPKKKDVDGNYVKLTRILLEAVSAKPANGNGLYPAIATHDEKMIRAAKSCAVEKKAPREAFEFQMLHGIRRDLQESLVREGYNVRVYVPYGSEWYPYVMRRLAERPANLWFILSNIFR